MIQPLVYEEIQVAALGVLFEGRSNIGREAVERASQVDGLDRDEHLDPGWHQHWSTPASAVSTMRRLPASSCAEVGTLICSGFHCSGRMAIVWQEHIGNGVLGSWLASVATQAGRTLAEKRADPPTSMVPAPPFQLTPAIQGPTGLPEPLPEPGLEGPLREVLLTPESESLEGPDWLPRRRRRRRGRPVPRRLMRRRRFRERERQDLDLDDFDSEPDPDTEEV